MQTRDFNYWRVLRGLGPKQIFLTWDFWVAAVLAGVGTYAIVQDDSSPAVHAAITNDLLSIAGALFGVVIAGFAIATALLNERYARMLERAGTSPYSVLRHFVAEGGIVMVSIIATITFRIFAVDIAQDRGGFSEQVALGIVIFLFLWGLFYALEIMKLVLGIAVTGAALSSVPESEEKRSTGS